MKSGLTFLRFLWPPAILMKNDLTFPRIPPYLPQILLFQALAAGDAKRLASLLAQKLPARVANEARQVALPCMGVPPDKCALLRP